MIVFNGFEIQDDQQVTGASMLSLINGIKAEDPRFGDIYDKYGIKDIQSDEWYPLILWLDVLHSDC